MNRMLIDRKLVHRFFSLVDETFGQQATIFLTGETSQLIEGWRPWSAHIEFCSSVRESAREAFNAAVVGAANHLGIPVTDEFPGEVIPLPAGYDDRSRPLTTDLGLPRLKVLHFDPYSISYRFLARGMEPDYHLILAYLEHDWVTRDELEGRLDDLLPEFSFATIQQDPAEFRRRFIGLMQMYRGIRAGQTHRPTSV